LDGKIATKNFESKWISCEESRKKVHELRSKVDAILIGENTVLKDNPKLTSRIENGRNPLRVIIAAKKLSPELNVFADKNFLVATTDSKLFFNKKFEGKVIELKGENNLVDLKKLIEVLGEKNISSLLVEGGSGIFTSFIKEKLADKLLLFISPKILGNDSIPVFGSLEIKEVKKGIQLKNLSFQKSGSDILVEGYF
jgi:diaminohydroxyphosphoribosylaminopyrimidine deaminase/5-amino-6-(5-phosphoribosylamino)uracil reductase